MVLNNKSTLFAIEGIYKNKICNLFFKKKRSLDLESKLNSKRSYRKGFSKSVDIDFIRMNYARKIFNIKFSSLINSEYLYINIDGVSFSFSAKYDRAYLKCGWSN